MPPDWAIGIMAGDSPLRLQPAPGINNPVLTARDVTDLDAAFIADPFMLETAGIWYLFFEVLPKADAKGKIALATSSDLRTWQYRQVVLAEDYHLSYPYVFEAEGSYYMLAETLKTRTVRLYVAAKFPTEWNLAAELIDVEAADPSILYYGGKWWLFACTRRNDCLSLYWAEELMGPWIPHPRNPIVNGNAQAARPAGRVLDVDGKLIRFAQDCVQRYGSLVRTFEILELTTSAYSERECAESPVLTPTGTGWNANRVHHIDAHRLPGGTWIACVDGS